jgi:hypothetical protein
MPNTTNFQIAYPAGTDYVKDGATAMGTIANGFDSLLGTIGVGGLRNAIINGEFSVNQRVFSSTTSTTTYGHDRWQLLKFGGTTTYSTQAFALGSPAASGYEASNYARLVTSGQSGAGDHSILKQAIENVRTFAGAPVTVSFWARAGSGTPSIAVELGQFFGTGGTPSVDVNTLLGKVQLSTNWTRYQLSVTLPNLSTKVLGTNGDHYLSLFLWTSAGSTFNTRTGTLGIQNATIDLWGVQVERGTRATPFERRPFGVELILCQRYYEKSYPYATAIGTASAVGATATCAFTTASGKTFMMCYMKATKRTNPSVTIYSVADGSAGFLFEYGFGNRAATPGNISDSSFVIYNTVVLAAANDECGVHWVANAEFS